MNRRWPRALAIAASIAILVAIRFSLAAEPDDKGPPDRPPAGPAGDAPSEAKTQKFIGTIAQFNFTPRGERDGILLNADGKLVQLNFPPHEAKKVTEGVAVGDQITAEGMPERTRADHTICRLQKLTTAKGQENSISSPPRARERGDGPTGPGDAAPGEGPPAGPPEGRDAGPGEGPGAGPGQRPGQANDEGPPQSGPRRQRFSGKTETLKGVVKSLNHGPRGEVDGVVLDNGDFIHTGPREAKEAKLEVGQEVSAEGHATKMPDGHMMIEHPLKINDKEMSRPPLSGRRAGPADRQPPNGDGPPPEDK